MPWKRMLAYVTGEVEESLLLRIEYLIEENRVLRSQLDRRLKLTRYIGRDSRLRRGATTTESPRKSGSVTLRTSDEFLDPTRDRDAIGFSSPAVNWR